MRFFGVFFILFSFTISASAFPEGTWPEYMRGHYLPAPKWVLVIPAKRNNDGTIKIWDREDQWNKKWLVPQTTPSGIKTVAITGDSEDQRNISAYQIDNMSRAAINKIANKYGASSVAIAVSDEQGNIAVAGWARGREATWQTAIATGRPRYDALSVIDEMYSASGKTSGGYADEYALHSNSVRIIAERLNPDTKQLEYRLDANGEIIKEIKASESLMAIAEYEDAPTILDVRVLDGRSIEDILFSMGINLNSQTR